MSGRLLAFVAGSLLLTSSCGMLIHDIYEDEKDPDWGLEEPEDFQTPSEVRARLVTDIRMRQLRENIDLGQETCSAIVFGEEGPMCQEHERQMTVVVIKPEREEGRLAIREKAYLCGEDLKYWYRWQKVDSGEVRWMGPYPSRLKKHSD